MATVTPQLDQSYWDQYHTYSAQAPAKSKLTDPRRYATSSRGSNPRALDVTDLSGSNRDAASALIQLFTQYGLETLAPKIIQYVQQGYGSDTIALLLQDTKEWKQRFAGNEARRKAGLAILSPAEYLATERSYRQIFEQFGIPKGFYDSSTDLAGFIGRDVSPTELQNRVQIASQFANTQDPATKKALRDMYGLGNGELTAWALDPTRALPVIQRQASAAQAGAAAIRQGLHASRGWAEHLADLGVTPDQADQGYANVAEMLPTYGELGKIYGQSYTQRTAELDVFEGNGAAVQKRKSLASQERAAFSGTSRGQVGKANRSSSY